MLEEVESGEAVIFGCLALASTSRNRLVRAGLWVAQDLRKLCQMTGSQKMAYINIAASPNKQHMKAMHAVCMLSGMTSPHKTATCTLAELCKLGRLLISVMQCFDNSLRTQGLTPVQLSFSLCLSLFLVFLSFSLSLSLSLSRVLVFSSSLSLSLSASFYVCLSLYVAFSLYLFSFFTSLFVSYLFYSTFIFYFFFISFCLSVCLSFSLSLSLSLSLSHSRFLKLAKDAPWKPRLRHPLHSDEFLGCSFDLECNIRETGFCTSRIIARLHLLHCHTSAQRIHFLAVTKSAVNNQPVVTCHYVSGPLHQGPLSSVRRPCFCFEPQPVFCPAKKCESFMAAPCTARPRGWHAGTWAGTFAY